VVKCLVIENKRRKEVEQEMHLFPLFSIFDYTQAGNSFS